MRFYTADVMIGSTLGWSQLMGLMEGHRTLQADVQRRTQRPAYQRAQSD